MYQFEALKNILQLAWSLWSEMDDNDPDQD